MCAPASTAAVTAAAVAQSRVGGGTVRRRAAGRETTCATGPTSDRPAELGELVEPREHLVAVRRLLREAEAGIDEDALRGDARAGRKRHALAQLVEHLVDDVVIRRLLVHVAAIARACASARSARRALATTSASAGS